MPQSEKESKEALSTETAPVESTPEAPATKPEAKGELSAGQKEAARYIDAFGEKGGTYFAEGLTFDQASTKHIASLNSTIEDKNSDLEAKDKEIKSLKSASETPVDLGDSSDKTDEKERKGFAAKIAAVNAADAE